MSLDRRRLADSARTILTVAEVLSVLTACVFPVSLTLQAASRRGIEHDDVYFLAGLAGLAIAAVIRRDLKRLIYLIGPCFLLTYSGLLLALCSGALIRGQASSSVVGLALGAAAAFLATLHGITSHPRA